MSHPVLELGDSYLPLVKGVHRGQFVMLEGPRGTSKTTGILSYLTLKALRNPGLRVLLARSTRTRLTQSILVTLEQQVFPRLGMAVPGGSQREGRSEYKLSNGSTLVTMGLDDKNRSTSAEYGLMYVAEAIEIVMREDVEALAGSLRQAVLPTWEPDFVHQCFVDCNPGPPQHWMNTATEEVPDSLRRVNDRDSYDRLLRHNWAQVDQIDEQTHLPKWKRIITKHQDNPYYFDVNTWEYTPAGEQYINHTLKNLRGHLRRRWLDGDWVSAEGIVFPEYQEELHDIEEFEFPTREWYSVVGVDPGYDHPCAVLWIGHAENDCLYVFDELYVTGMGVKDVADKIKEKNRNADYMIKRNVADPQHAFRKTMDSPTPIASQFKNNGIAFAPWPRSTDKEAMVENLRSRFVNNKIKIFKRCKNLRNELTSWAYKRNTKGEQLKGDDQYEDANNHAIDVLLGVNAMNLKWDGKYQQTDTIADRARAREKPLANPRTFKRIGNLYVPQ
jgi:PBSX family phage terminase large subunit